MSPVITSIPYRAFIVVFVLFLLSAALLSAGPLGGGGAARSRAAETERSAPSGQNLSAAQQGNLQKLQADLAALKAGSQVTPELKAAVKTSLLALADGATRPSQESVSALAGSLSSALADQDVSQQEKVAIARSVQAVLASAGLPPEEVDQLVAATSELLLAAGVDRSDVQMVVADLQAIATEARSNLAP